MIPTTKSSQFSKLTKKSPISWFYILSKWGYDVCLKSKKIWGKWQNFINTLYIISLTYDVISAVLGPKVRESHGVLDINSELVSISEDRRGCRKVVIIFHRTPPRYLTYTTNTAAWHCTVDIFNFTGEQRFWCLGYFNWFLMFHIPQTKMNTRLAQSVQSFLHIWYF